MRLTKRSTSTPSAQKPAHILALEEECRVLSIKANGIAQKVLMKQATQEEKDAAFALLNEKCASRDEEIKNWMKSTQI